MKKYLIVYYGDATECVEGFHKDCKRSCKGALHVKPSRQMTVTEGEMEHLKKHYSHMMPKLRVLSEMKDEPKKEEKESEKKPKPSKEESKEEKSSDEAPKEEVSKEAAQEGKKKKTRKR